MVLVNTRTAILLVTNIIVLALSAPGAEGRTPSLAPSPIPYSKFDHQIIDRAFEVAVAMRTKKATAHGLKEYAYGVLVRLPNMACVGIIEVETTGPAVTICFDSAGKKVALTHIW